MTIKRFDLLQPTTLDEAVGLLEEHADEASLIAGGTALLIMLRERVYQPPYLIDLKTVPGLDQIRHEPGVGMRLGALVCHRDVELSPLVRERLPVLAETYRQVGNVRVRHAATVGGNLAHGDYRLDPPAPLIALRAVARLVGPAGPREVPLEEFFFGLYATALEPGEILTEEIGTRAAEQVEPTPDIRGSEWYKREMARVFTARAIRAALRGVPSAAC